MGLYKTIPGYKKLGPPVPGSGQVTTCMMIAGILHAVRGGIRYKLVDDAWIKQGAM